MMKKEFKKKALFWDHVGCFGEFQKEDLVCRRYCALNIRCIIEQDQNTRMEIFEDMVASETLPIKIQ
jgi:hypothetical protein